MIMSFRVSLIFLTLVAWPGLALAAEPQVMDPWESGLKTIAALLVVLAIILGGYALVRKGIPFLPGQKEGAIKVVEWRSLGAKKSLCLVRVRGKEFLLGVGNEQISLLTQMDTPPSFENALDQGMRDQP